MELFLDRVLVDGEENCLVKFNEFMGFSTVDFEVEIQFAALLNASC